MTSLKTRLILRNDVLSNWTAANPTLLKGELAIEWDNKKFKIGDGVTPYNELDYWQDGYVTDILNQMIEEIGDKPENVDWADGSIWDAIATEVAAREAADTAISDATNTAISNLKSNINDLIDNYYDKDEIDSKLSGAITSVFKFKGTVATIDLLQTIKDPQIGDVWHVSETHDEYVYAQVDDNTAAGWENLGSIVNLENYVTKEELKKDENRLAVLEEAKEQDQADIDNLYGTTERHQSLISEIQGNLQNLITGGITESNLEKTLLDKINFITSVETKNFSVKEGKLEIDALEATKLIDGDSRVIFDNGDASSDNTIGGK